VQCSLDDAAAPSTAVQAAVRIALRTAQAQHEAELRTLRAALFESEQTNAMLRRTVQEAPGGPRLDPRQALAERARRRALERRDGDLPGLL